MLNFFDTNNTKPKVFYFNFSDTVNVNMYSFADNLLMYFYDFTDNYNPMMGHGGGGGYRPNRRNPSGGG